MQYSLDTLDQFIKILSSKIVDKNSIVLLRGDLASGKTTLVKHYVKYIGLEDNVTSPTFALQSIYDDKIFHYDLYNKGLEEFIALGMLEEFEKEGIHFVEWGEEDLESLLHQYGYDVIVIEIEKKDDKREYKIA